MIVEKLPFVQCGIILATLYSWKESCFWNFIVSENLYVSVSY